jgi:hypothetical protein
MLTYEVEELENKELCVCVCVLYADVFGRMRTYADVCGRMLTYAIDELEKTLQALHPVFTYADVCERMRT